ncbi:DUF975 family protein [Candidatus Sulfidibacterium hydrothermale]|uniref:DUF975 family protein n=1 Tax=Candidatus Sulfidibacterium hydrothermale TaxID=2875962 RepID=UPI001F0AFD93|nr:DUF975 family protein [Candidatus Sulfidibacterium hydrothermale]UBM62867.1 DUF975 family protein [Candidatus Sulfidibacterium hydrothermale]
MISSNMDLIEKARLSIKGRWGLAIGAFLVVTIIQGGLQSIGKDAGNLSGLIPYLAALAVGGPFSLGTSIFSLSFVRDREPRFEEVFEGFKDFKRSLVTYLLLILIVFAWSLLLIIPGIIAAISYSMTFYVLADDPNIKPTDALDKSKQMMKGYKWKYFGLLMLFFLGAILCLLTLGIGFLWFIPWVNVTEAHFYEEIKDNPAVTIQTV